MVVVLLPSNLPIYNYEPLTKRDGIQCLAEYTGPKHILAMPLDRHKAVLASFMRLQEHLLPSDPSLYLQSKTT